VSYSGQTGLFVVYFARFQVNRAHQGEQFHEDFALSFINAREPIRICAVQLLDGRIGLSAFE
jgi:hypothetical protein